MKNNTTYLKSNIDWTLIGLFLILVVIGFLNLYSSDLQITDAKPFMQTAYGKQFMWIVFSLVIAIVILFIEPVAYPLSSYVIYAFVTFLLILVIIMGKTVNDSKSWLNFAGIGLQPSELAKFATAMAFARYLARNSFDFGVFNLKKIILLLGIIVFPLALIFLQPDFGTALSFIAFSIVLYREGMSGLVLLFMALMAIVFVFAIKINEIVFICILSLIGIVAMLYTLINKKFFRNLLVVGVISFAAIFFIKTAFAIKLSWYNIIFLTIIIISFYAIILFWLRRESKSLIIVIFFFSAIFTQFSSDLLINKILKQHHRDRIEVLFDESVDPQGIGYNLHQSKIAIASGGFFGKGYLQGTQTKLNFVPAHNTDFIFCTIAEEWGLLGSIVLLTLYTLLLVRIINKAEKQVSAFSRIYGYCVASFLFVHILINIAMAIGLFPVVGIPLPFFSYGGSSMLSFTLMLFVFIKLDSQRNLNF